MIRYTLVGKKAIKYTSKKDNQEKEAIYLYAEYQDVKGEAEGTCCEAMFVSKDVFTACPLKLKQVFTVSRNRYGNVEDIIPLT